MFCQFCSRKKVGQLPQHLVPKGHLAQRMVGGRPTRPQSTRQFAGTSREGAAERTINLDRINRLSTRVAAIYHGPNSLRGPVVLQEGNPLFPLRASFQGRPRRKSRGRPEDLPRQISRSRCSCRPAGAAACSAVRGCRPARRRWGGHPRDVRSEPDGRAGG